MSRKHPQSSARAEAAEAGHDTAGRARRGVRLSMIPVLIAGIGAFWIAEALALRRSGALSADALLIAWTWLAMLAVWGVTSGWLSLSGRYARPRFLAALPGLWVPAVPVVVTAVALLASPLAREAASLLSRGIADADFVLLQAMRLAALGSVIKARAGEMPRGFGLGLGIADTLFGLSALGIALAGTDAVPAPVLLLWNVAGAALLLTALPVLQMSLPGPLQRFRSLPDGRVLFDFPLVLAPTLVAPLFLLTNLAHGAGLAARILPG